MTRADDLALIERCLAARDIHTMSERGHACAIYAADRDRLCALARAGLNAAPAPAALERTGPMMPPEHCRTRTDGTPIPTTMRQAWQDELIAANAEAEYADEQRKRAEQAEREREEAIALLREITGDGTSFTAGKIRAWLTAIDAERPRK